MACDRLDKVVKRSLGDADTLIALSGSGLYSGLQLQRHGGVYICDRGSTHILFQEQILREEADIVGLPRQQINDHVIMKELAEYAAADAILTPSIFTLATFLARGIPREKLMLVPYGINTKTFSPRLPKSPHFSVLFAGQTTYRKGIHYLLKAWRQWRPANAELRIAGSRSAEFDALAAWAGGLPPGVTLLGHLDRQTLANEMATAHALIMPSIEEGLPLVMAQAMACGTPVIATVNSGAETLFEHGKSGLIGHARSVDFLVESLEQLAHHSGMASALAAAAVTRSANFGSARAYGQRVLAALETTKTRRGL
jgi:glycosyltransferase involved in cell wall biosynthesis